MEGGVAGLQEHVVKKKIMRIARRDPDVQALIKACEWIERSTSERAIHATAKFIFDRYVLHPPPDAPWRGRGDA